MRFWARLPVIVRAIISGGLMATAGTVPWGLLAGLNLRHMPSVPWALVPAALFLWIFWRYAQGAWWPRSTREARRKSLRANSLAGEVWGAAMVAVVVGLVAVVLMQRVMNRLVVLPQQQDVDIMKLPVLTIALLVAMGSLVAGVVEEGSYSIFPGMVLHAGGNALAAIDLFARGQSEWQASSSPAPLVWEAGADASFWISLVAFLFVASAAVWAYAGLAAAARAAGVMHRPDTQYPTT